MSLSIRNSVIGALLALPSIAAAQQSRAVKQTPLPLKRRATPTSAAITAEDLMSRLYVFADDSMQGREAGTPGQIKASAYIARELKRLGLTPAGDSGTYFQDIPFVSRRFAKSSDLHVGPALFNAYADYVAFPFRGAFPRAINGRLAVYGGTWGDTTKAITEQQADDRIVVVFAPNGLTRVPATGPLARAAAVMVIGGDRMTEQQLALGHTLSYALTPTPDMPTVPVVMVGTRLMAEQILGRGVDTMTIGHVGGSVSGELVFEETKAPTRNVVAVLPGANASLRGEYVAIGAHSDHIGYRVAGPIDHDSAHVINARRYFITSNPSGNPLSATSRADRDGKLASLSVNADSIHHIHPARKDSINNGADDDGSGTVTLLEVAEAFAKARTKPARSLLFVWHTGEEKGLLGSRYFTDHPTVPRDSIVAQINMDQIGRGAAADLPNGGDHFLMVVGSRRLSTELGDLAESVNKALPNPFALDYAYDANGHPENVYCRSDHYNYARYGIPIVFFTTGLHGDYHQVTDEPQYIDYPHMARIGQYIFNFANRIAGLDHRPLVDKPKPDPNGVCRQ